MHDGSPLEIHSVSGTISIDVGSVSGAIRISMTLFS